MKFTAFALLITGLAAGVMLPGEASSDQGYAPPGQPQGAPGWGQFTYTKPQTETWRPPSSPGFRFRPWTEREAQQIRRHSPAYPLAPSAMPWGSPYAVQTASGYRNWAPSRYRFRPMDVQPQHPPVQQPAGYVYRPMQVEISGQYVYRPLNPVKKAPRPYNRPPAPTPFPRYAGPSLPPPGFAYAGYPDYSQPSVDPRTRPQSRYVYGSPYAGPRFRPQQPVDRYVADYSAARRMPAPGYVFRESRPRPYRGYPPQYAWRPRDAERSFERRLSARSVPQPGYPGQYEPWMGRGPVWGAQRLSRAVPPPLAPYNNADAPRVVQNPYGVDWYDGRSDGEGAWYKLVESKEWPRVTQHWTGD